jgi:Ca2+-binding RTX toxin-like protein
MIKGFRGPVVQVLTISLFALLLISGSISHAAPRRCLGQRATVKTKASGVTRGTRGSDVIVGTPRRDVIEARRGFDLVCGRGGNDVIKGGPGSDRLVGQGGSDRLNGGRGFEDLLIGGLGNDVLDGGPGQHAGIAAYSDSPNGVAVNLGTGAANGRGKDTLINISGIADSQFHDFLTGSGNDGEGFFMSSGSDMIDGGGGEFDLVAYADASVPVTIDLAAGTAVGQGIDARMSGIEDVVGSTFNDTLTGNDLANFMWGVDGDDTVSSGNGDDFIEIPLGNDDVDGGAGLDIAAFVFAEGSVTADLATGTGTVDASPRETSTFSNMESMFGSFGFDDTLLGTDGANRIIGLGGSDNIDGLGGDDFLDGDFFDEGAVFPGTDDLDGGTGTDTCVNGEVETNCEADPAPTARRKTEERRLLEVHRYLQMESQLLR